MVTMGYGSAWLRSAAFIVGCSALGAAAIGCGGDPVPSAIAVDEQGGAITVIAGTFDRTCDEAKSIIMECGRWEILVHVDPPAQSGGPKPIASADTWAENLYSDGEPGGLECLIVGGSFEKGTIEITGMDDSSVSFVIAGTQDGEFDADGAYDAYRCP